MAGDCRGGVGASDCIIDGEICALDEQGAPDFAALQAALSEGTTDDLVYFAFDLLFEGDEDLRELPLTERKSRLETLIADAGDDPRLRFVEHFETGGDAVLKSACKLSLEGIVSKQADAHYVSAGRRPGRNPNVAPAMKLLSAATPRPMGNSARCLLASSAASTSSTLVVSGQATAPRRFQQLSAETSGVETSKSPFTGIGAPEKTEDIVWLKPELVAEIRVCRMDSGRSGPSGCVQGLREDKPAAEVEAEEPAAPSDADVPDPETETPRPNAREKAQRRRSWVS